MQIVAIRVVSGENEDNWFWFLDFVLKNLEKMPRFVISDQDNGIIPAVTKIVANSSSEILHVYCFCHVAENFNKKFNSKMLWDLAWELARART